MSIEQAAQSWGGELTQAPVREGEAWRAPARWLEGDVTREAIAYWWPDTRRARRVVQVSRPGMAGDLFVVPEIVSQDLDHGLVLLAPIAGEPLRAWLDREVGPDAPLAALDEDRAHALLHALGRLLRKLHGTVAPAVFGDVLPEAAGARWSTFNGLVAAQLERHGEQINEGSFSDEQRQALLTSLGDLRHELVVFHPRHPGALVHRSCALDHFWVDPAGREIVGWTGFDRAAYLPPEYDIAAFLWTERVAEDEALTRSFYQGYGAARTMDVQRRERFYRRLIAFELLANERPHRGQLTRDTLIAMTSPV